jgi:hypothetical protein
MAVHTEIRSVQIGPGISATYRIFSVQSPLHANPDDNAGNVGDLYVSPTTLHVKNSNDQWIVVADEDRIYHPLRECCLLCFSDTGPRWSFTCESPATIAHAVKQHLQRIEREEIYFPDEEDDLDDDGSDEDSDWSSDEEGAGQIA